MGEGRVRLERFDSARLHSGRNLAEFLYPDFARLGKDRIGLMPRVTDRVVHAVVAYFLYSVENFCVAETPFVAERALEIFRNYSRFHVALLIACGLCVRVLSG